MKENFLFRFLFPVFSRGLLFRILFITLAAYLIFGYLCTPIILRGKSMEPTYLDGSINFCWRLRYLFHPPERNDVVMIRLAGDRIMLMKRVVALEGEWVEFRDGDLFVNNRKMDEPFAFSQRNWNLPPRQVEPGCIYVVGDNRRTSIDRHNFGQTSLRRVMGGPLW